MRRYCKLIFGAGVFIAVGSVLLTTSGPSKNSVLFDNAEKTEFIDANFHELKEIIEESVAKAQQNYQDEYQNRFEDQYIQLGVTSHHLPTAAPLISDLYTYLNHSQGPRDVFVILGPDHYERGYTSVSTTLYPFNTPFGILEVESNIVSELLEKGVNIDNQALIGEHSIGVQAIFIKLFFPQAHIVPLIFRANTNEQLIADIAEVLARYKDKITVIASVDFSHYYPYKYAQVLDAESKTMLSNFNFDSFTLEYADSPACLKLLGQLTQSFQAVGIAILDVANSYDFTGKTDNTTGYINTLFSKKSLKDAQTLMFVGDIMLSRAVEEKMKSENNWQWPFLKITDYLQKADLLFGNLEGPISDKGRNVGSIYSFRADPRAIEGLKYISFDVLSVANNHIGDWGREAMEDTFKILKEGGIDYIGGGYDEIEAYSPVIKELDNGTKVAFLAYTNLASRNWEAEEDNSGIAWLDKEQMERDIKKAKTRADIVIVSMHFGEEYITHSNASQQFFARAAIDAEADLVVGHHPHVIQELEEYKDGYIAYSLGNFVFDQSFSKETTQGLILCVIIEDNQIKEIKPIEVKISNFFQPEIISE